MNELSLFNTLFDDNCVGFPVFKTSTNYVPKVDVKETKNAYVLDMDLPGLSEKDVEIDLKDNILTVASKDETPAENEKEHKSEEKNEVEEDWQWLIHERRTTTFERRFSLPQDIDSETISAVFKNGVLTVTIPRKAQASARRINISVA
ncbi:MAG: Hsp20/alpha crystallin family protein [Treponema sp.]|nr:Hsp20/alpha crystallin family protein [Treponema sp.]